MVQPTAADKLREIAKKLSDDIYSWERETGIYVFEIKMGRPTSLSSVKDEAPAPEIDIGVGLHVYSSSEDG